MNNYNFISKNFNILEETIPDLIIKFNIAGFSCVFFKDGTVRWENCCGFSNKEKDIPVTSDVLFEAASLTKPVVAFVTLKLWEEGMLELDNPLSNYLSEPYLIKESLLNQITAKHVLTHTTGFPNWAKVRGKPKIYFTPGERFSYSGEGYIYLQKVLENITEQSLEELIQEKLFVPLGISTASLIWKEDYEEIAAQGYLKDGRIKKWKPLVPCAAGSLHITPSDYAKFMISLLKRNVEDNFQLQECTLNEMFKPAVPVSNAGLDNKHKIPKSKIKESDSVFWGLGWGLEINQNKTNFWHWGNNTSFHSLAIASREERSGFVMMSNSERAPLIWYEIMNLIMREKHPGFDWLMSFY